MSTFPGSPRLLKGGIVLIDPTSGAVQRSIACNTTRTRSAARCGCRVLAQRVATAARRCD